MLFQVSGFSAALLQDVLAVKAEEPEEESAPAEQKAKKAPKSERTPMEVMCCALDKPVFAAVAVASDDRAVVEPTPATHETRVHLQAGEKFVYGCKAAFGSKTLHSTLFIRKPSM